MSKVVAQAMWSMRASWRKGRVQICLPEKALSGSLFNCTRELPMVTGGQSPLVDPLKKAVALVCPL